MKHKKTFIIFTAYSMGLPAKFAHAIKVPTALKAGAFLFLAYTTIFIHKILSK